LTAEKVATGGFVVGRAAGDAWWWLAIRWVGVAGTFVLLWGLFASPDLTLKIWWNLVVPLLPISFLISASMWRAVCPLASFNTAGNGLLSRRSVTARGIERAGLIGVLLLAILVPARRFVFNADGTVLGVVIVAVILVAFLLGTVFDLKAGFCNSICPVLPVERLYGQHPLFEIKNPRCPTCTACTGKGCIDLSPEKSIAQVLGPTRRSYDWLSQSFGAFAATFPGAVFAYFSLVDGNLSSAGIVYLTIAVGAVASYVLTQILVRLFKIPAGVAIACLAGVAIGVYYWFVTPAMVSTVGLDAGIFALRAVLLGVVVWWMWRALRIELNKGKPE